VRIEGYGFGRIRIDGRDYTQDVIILRDRIVSPWWREAGGHVFALQDLGDVIASAPAVVILGTGNVGMVRVPRETLEELERQGIEPRRLRTARAVDEYNRLQEAGRDVAAALHLTC
jgi:hypothetical protein